MTLCHKTRLDRRSLNPRRPRPPTLNSPRKSPPVAHFPTTLMIWRNSRLLSHLYVPDLSGAESRVLASLHHSGTFHPPRPVVCPTLFGTGLFRFLKWFIHRCAVLSHSYTLPPLNLFPPQSMKKSRPLRSFRHSWVGITVLVRKGDSHFSDSPA